MAVLCGIPQYPQYSIRLEGRGYLCTQTVYFLQSTRSIVTWLNSWLWLAAWYWVMLRYLKCCQPTPDVAENLGLYRSGEWLWIDSNGRNKNYKSRRMLLFLVVNFRPFVIIAELWKHEVARRYRLLGNFCVCLEKRLLTVKIFKILFRKFWSRHRSTCCVHISWNLAELEIGEIVLCLPDKNKQKFAWLSSCRYCANRGQNLPQPTPDNVLRVLQISSKSVHFRWSYSRTREHQ